MILTWDEYITLLVFLAVMFVAVCVPAWLFLNHTRLGRTLCEVLNLTGPDEGDDPDEDVDEEDEL